MHTPIHTPIWFKSDWLAQKVRIKVRIRIETKNDWTEWVRPVGLKNPEGFGSARSFLLKKKLAFISYVLIPISIL